MRSTAFSPSRMASSARSNSSKPIWPTRGLNLYVGRISRQPRTRKTILHDAERGGHDSVYVWRITSLAEDPRVKFLVSELIPGFCIKFRERPRIEPQSDPNARTRASRFPDNIRIEIDGDNHIGA